jgi:hypothetical protein
VVTGAKVQVWAEGYQTPFYPSFGLGWRGEFCFARPVEGLQPVVLAIRNQLLTHLL